ncbi:MAG TPA: ABC transporter ATP-binding protein [Vicinamibacterales bacterium]|nr:ABC transporter ATP-binding protein [Vicinamibacterales bacterium]
MIDVQQLRKQYGDLVAVDDVSFRAEKGSIFGLLGPNGAGKTTTISCISGLLKPTSGRITVSGHDVVTDGPAARRHLGIVPQELALYSDLSAAANLEFWGSAYGVTGEPLRRRVAEVLALIGLADRGKDHTSTFSGGMKRRLNFGCGIVHNPKVLLLDEPTAGVDPQSRVRLLELVREQARAGTTVIYTTHYMEEAQDLCDRIAIVDRGKLLAMGTLDELRRMVGEKDLVRLAGRFDPAAATRALEAVDDVKVLSAAADVLTIATVGASRKLPAIFTTLASAGSDIHETTLSVPSLESLFITLTGRELRE